MLHLFLLISTAFSVVQPEWTWKIFPETGFKVLSPFEFIHEVNEIPTETLPLTYHQYRAGTLQNTDLHLAFVIDHYTLEAQEIGGDESHLNEFFGVTIDQILKSIDGKLDYMDFTTYPDRHVCAWRATYQNGQGLVRGQMLIYGDKYFGLQVFGLTEEKPDGNMHKFLDSFRLLDQKP